MEESNNVNTHVTETIEAYDQFLKSYTVTGTHGSPLIRTHHMISQYILKHTLPLRKTLRHQKRVLLK